MSESGDYAAMSDPDFLAERTRVRDELQQLTERFRQLNEEFDRRARAAWRPPPARSTRDREGLCGDHASAHYTR